jgi:hypothetical protein
MAALQWNLAYAAIFVEHTKILGHEVTPQIHRAEDDQATLVQVSRWARSISRENALPMHCLMVDWLLRELAKM